MVSFSVGIRVLKLRSRCTGCADADAAGGYSLQCNIVVILSLIGYANEVS